MSSSPAYTASLGSLTNTRAKTRRDRPLAVVDIGSNSVRLVIYETASRMPSVVHNEKSICAIGRNMVSTGRLNDDGIAMALEALKRFRMIVNAHGVEAREAVATAAARDAANGRDFVRRAEAAWGSPIRVLSGEEEARTAAEGVLAGIPEADGLVGDLGGGSLDMVTVKGGKTGAALTLPYGPLRLMDATDGDVDDTRNLVDKGLHVLETLGKLDGRSLYAVGGIWRSFARVDMEEIGYPLHVLQQYTIPRERALRLCKVISRLSMKSLERMKVVSKRRAESLPYGAIVLERLLLATNMKDVVISAYGLREGLLFAQLAEEERAKDPLIEFASGMNGRLSRVPQHAAEMIEWTTQLFSPEKPDARRIREAFCYFSDIAWRRHPDDRSLGGFNQVLTAPFSGADHRARAMIATAVFHRYSGDEDFPREYAAAGLLSKDDEEHAIRLGLAARLAFSLSASAVGELPHYTLRMTPTRVLLDVPARRETIAGEPVQKRLGALAEAFDRKGEILIG
jgi:exopolyphosphatase/guanosine-5'-triphosphate,3'-diphosphate pyrophosphatase